jgi:hypothetical protein
MWSPPLSDSMSLPQAHAGRDQHAASRSWGPVCNCAVWDCTVALCKQCFWCQWLCWFMSICTDHVACTLMCAAMQCMMAQGLWMPVSSSARCRLPAWALRVGHHPSNSAAISVMISCDHVRHSAQTGLLICILEGRTHRLQALRQGQTLTSRQVRIVQITLHTACQRG